jgi:hypothetical protein
MWKKKLGDGFTENFLATDGHELPSQYMILTDQHIDQAFNDLKRGCGGVREDYFGLLYLEKFLNISRDDAILQVAFGGNDYGLDGYHLDAAAKNLYLFQFNFSTNPNLFASSFERLIEAGMSRIFGNALQDGQQNQMLAQLRRDLFEKKDLVSRVLIHFIFKGDPAEAGRSKLVCQAMLNDKELEDYAERFGQNMVVEVDYTNWISDLAANKVRHLLKDLVEEEPYARKISIERYDFLKTRTVYDRCMEIAYKKWRWIERTLR